MDTNTRPSILTPERLSARFPAVVPPERRLVIAVDYGTTYTGTLSCFVGKPFILTYNEVSHMPLH